MRRYIFFAIILIIIIVTGSVFLFYSLWNGNRLPNDTKAPNIKPTASDTTLVNPEISLAGKPEVVFNFSAKTGCSETDVLDIVDSRAFAFRRDDGKVVLFAASHENFSFVGDTLDTVKRDGCRRVFVSPEKSKDPADFHGGMWLKGAVETPQEDIMGIIHNEYHGELYFKDACLTNKERRGDEERACWYASSLMALSYDGGKTFDTSSTKVLATMPFKFEVGQGRTGYNSPYILSRREGDSIPYMYVFFSLSDQGNASSVTLTKSGERDSGACLMRGTSADQSTWRMWGGTDFDVTVANPYTSDVTNPDAHKCETVLPFGVGAVKYISSQKVYVALGSGGPNVLYAVSRDLIHWTKPKTLTTFSNKERWKVGDPPPMSYFSLLDPTSPSRSFETIEGRPYMYYVDNPPVDGKKVMNLTRRLMRVPLTIEFK